MFKFKQIARVIAIHALMLVGAATAWAGRGDVDPNYGEGGRLQIPSGVLLALPGDRLVIADGGTGEGFRVRMVDATGQNVPSFGDGGTVLIDSLAAARTFRPEAAALGPNGDMIFMGALSDTQARVLLRLDKDGQPVLSFGNPGDGFVEPAGTTTGAIAFAIAPDGKILLAEGSWNPDGSCENTAQLQRLLANGQPDTGFGVDGIIEIQNLDICNGAPVFGARPDGGVLIGHGQTIVAIDAAGDIDPTFGVDGRLVVGEVAWPSGLLLPDGGVLIFGLRGVSPTANNTVFLKFDRNGQPDLDFGQGTGSVTVDLGAELLGKPFALEAVEQLALDPDGEHIVARLKVFEFNGPFYCGGISRLAIDGAPDTDFGRNGLTCLNFDFSFIVSVQSNGAPLFRLPDGENGIVYRLLPDNSPSPGFLRLLTTSVWVDESERTATVAVERFAGRDGAVSVDYATSYRPPGGTPGHCSGCGHRWDSATADSDYMATSGRLDWASGDDTQRTVTVSILEDDINEITEIFGVDFSEPSGVVQLVPCRACNTASSSIFITADGTATTPRPTSSPTSSPTASGGGGSVLWETPLALLTLLFIRRRRIRRAIARIASLPGLLLLVTAAAWAGRGDVDPNYGEGGRLQIPPSVLLALPGGRLVVGEGTGEGFRVRMVDATGRNVPAFGEGGVVLIDSSAAARTFLPETAALAANGDMIFLGALSDTLARAVLRLDNDGQPLLSFGNRGDALVEPALTAARATSFAIDPDGKILLAEGSWTPDQNCGSTARLQRLLANGQPDTGYGGDGITEVPNLDICNGALVFGSRADGGVIVGDGQTIVAVDAAGDVDARFGVDGRLAVTELDGARVLLLPDGGLLIVGSDTLTGSSDTTFVKFDRNGQPDLDFGPGTGSVTVDLGSELVGQPSARENVELLALDPDGEHVATQLQLSVSSGNGYARLLCSGIARLSIDGTPDAGFGRNGVTCLNFGFDLTAVQSDGAPLVGNDGAIYRLLPDNNPSPGLLRLVESGSTRIAESVGTVTLAIERLAGRDGAVSVNFATVYRRGNYVRYPGDHIFSPADSATAGSDYTATSGRLDWASGDDGQRTITVSILNDDTHENIESFGVDPSEPSGAVLLTPDSLTIFITDDDQASSTPPPPPPPPPSGGGGSVSWATQLALLTLLFIRRRRIRRTD